MVNLEQYKGAKKIDDIEVSICPNCGGKLVERVGPFGTFWGCSNYPHCRFKASPDPHTGEITFSS